jgi:hypothetical protein
MRRSLQLGSICLLLLWNVSPSRAQREARLETRDVAILFEAKEAAPHLKQLSVRGQLGWSNRWAETLPDHVEVEGKSF